MYTSAQFYDGNLKFIKYLTLNSFCFTGVQSAGVKKSGAAEEDCGADPPEE
jgi:hypothetical protein